MTTKSTIALVCLAVASMVRAAEIPEAPKLQFEITRLVNNLNEGCAVADVNNDGRPDIIAGPHWYEGPAWRQHALRTVGERENEFMQNNGDHAIDLNGDGWVDVIAASWFSGDICWYENPKEKGLQEARLWQQRKIIGDKGQCEGTILTDINGDGIPEFVLNHWNRERPVSIIRMTPGKNGAEPKFEEFIIAKTGNDHGMTVGDINGDGRPDLVFGYGWYETPAGDPFADPKKWVLHEAFGVAHICVPGVVADVNGDGKNDFILGHAHDYGVMWFEQGRGTDGKPTWTQHEIDKSWSQAHCLVWADLDGDGKCELITGKRYRSHGDGDPGGKEPPCLFRYVYNAKTGVFHRDTISHDKGIGTGMQIRVADLDGDKKPDLAVAGKSGTYVLLNRGLAEGK